MNRIDSKTIPDVVGKVLRSTRQKVKLVQHAFVTGAEMNWQDIP